MDYGLLGKDLTFPGAGHFLLREAADRVLAKINAFYPKPHALTGYHMRSARPVRSSLPRR